MYLTGELTWAKGVTMKSSAVCLRWWETERKTRRRTLTPMNSILFLSFIPSLTLHWRERSSARLSWATCRSLSQSGRGKTLFSGPEERRCVGWGPDSGNPMGCDLVTRHFLLHNWSVMRSFWALERREKETSCQAVGRVTSVLQREVRLCANLSASACVMEIRGGMRRGRVVGRDTLFRTSGERVRSRGRSQQGTCRVRIKISGWYYSEVILKVDLFVFIRFSFKSTVEKQLTAL